MHRVGRIDKERYGCITENIVTDEVIITDNQLAHIKQRHPDAYDDVLEILEQAVRDPDWIIEDKHCNTGLIIKRLESTFYRESIQVALRLRTSEELGDYKNSIISCWKISEKRLQNYLRNKKILYKKE